ncbi:MAG: cytochrome c [Bacteriovorax sp.]|jgi:hypothetical protein
MNKKFFLFLTFGFSFSLVAEIDRCKENDSSQKNYVCGQCEKKDVEFFFGSDMGPEGKDPANEKNRQDFKNGFLFDLGKTSGKVKNAEGKSIDIKNLKTVEDFVEFLPEKFKKDVVFISPSRSLQEGDRYLMKSPNGEMIMSFNTHPKEGKVTDLRGGNAVEMQVWNGAKAVWEYVEIDFTEGKPKISRNPDKCLRCHGFGSNTRPNFDPYNFWAETKPFFKDRLIPGTKEAEDYLKFLERIDKESKAYKSGKGPKTRYALLDAMLKVNPVEKVRDALSKGQTYQLRVDESSGFNTNKDGGQSVNIFDQMYFTNHCRIANLTTNPKHNPLANQMKYALQGILKGCYRSEDDLKKAVPQSFIDNANAYFKGKGLGGGKFNDVFKDTSDRQKDYYEDRIGRKLWTMESEQLDLIKNSKKYIEDLREAGNSPEKKYQIEMAAEKEAYIKAKKQMQTLAQNSSSAADKEDSVRSVAPLRFLLEPTGVDTSMFSISVDPLSYTFGDFFFNLGRFGAYKDLAGKSCEELNSLSMKAFKSPEGQKAIAQIKPTCKQDFPGVLDPVWAKSVSKISGKVLADRHEDLKKKVTSTFLVCSACHANGAMGAPDIPFGDMNKMDKLLSKQAGEIGDMQTRIWKRVRRHGDLRGAMPMGMGQIAPQALKDVKEYLESFDKRDYIEKIDTGSARRSIINVNVPKN